MPIINPFHNKVHVHVYVHELEEKLAQFQEEVRLGQEEATAMALKKARYDNSSCRTAYLS